MWFIILFILLILWEVYFPVRSKQIVFSARKVGNITLYPLLVVSVSFIKSVCVWLMATYLSSGTPGIFSVIREYPVLYTCFSFLILDLGMYLQHRLLHASSFLWSIHALHHSDTEVDITTYFRHHPFEVIFSVTATYGVVVLFGITPALLGVYLIVNNIFQIVQHSNIKIPDMYNKWLIYIIATPAFHSVHHSRIRKEADANYSTIFSMWDRIFGTYIQKETSPNTFGIDGFESERYQGLDRMLLMPFLIWFKKEK